ncbi:MAG TPA: class I SAM-dependent methyltransferase [Chloroflexota bacterium]
MTRTIGVVALVLASVAAVVLRRRTRWINGQRWYAIVYRTLYKLGLRIWERRAPAADLVALVEGPASLPAGRALDLGCGTATDSIYLAQHGWDVTGVDMVPEALSIARRRASAAGVAPQFVEGDVTRLLELDVHGPFSLVLDFGCLHTLPMDRRGAYVDSVSAVAAPGATFLLYGFARPPKFAPMQAGLTEHEVNVLFERSGWDILSADRVLDDAIQVARARVDRSFELWRYRLRRRGQVVQVPLDAARRHI